MSGQARLALQTQRVTLQAKQNNLKTQLAELQREAERAVSSRESVAGTATLARQKLGVALEMLGDAMSSCARGRSSLPAHVLVDSTRGGSSDVMWHSPSDADVHVPEALLQLDASSASSAELSQLLATTTRVRPRRQAGEPLSVAL